MSTPFAAPGMLSAAFALRTKKWMESTTDKPVVETKDTTYVRGPPQLFGQ